MVTPMEEPSARGFTTAGNGSFAAASPSPDTTRYGGVGTRFRTSTSLVNTLSMHNAEAVTPEPV